MKNVVMSLPKKLYVRQFGMWFAIFLFLFLSLFIFAQPAHANGEQFEWLSKNTARMYGGDWTENNVEGSNDSPLEFTLAGGGEDVLKANRPLTMNEGNFIGVSDQCTLWLKIVREEEATVPIDREVNGETIGGFTWGWFLQIDTDRREDPGGHGLCSNLNNLKWDTSFWQTNPALTSESRDNFADVAQDSYLIIKEKCPNIKASRIDALSKKQASDIRNKIAEQGDSYTCQDIENEIAKIEREIAFDGPNEGEDVNEVSCRMTQGVIGFLICPVVNSISGITNFFFKYIINAMHFSLFRPANNDGQLPNGGSGLPPDGYSGVRTSWQFVARLSTIILVVAFLIMVIGQAVSNFFDAYSIKKILPRIIIAVIAINLSWFLVTFAIEVGNVIGAGVRDIILAPFSADNKVVQLVVPSPTGSDIFDLLVVGGAGVTGLAALFLSPGLLSWAAWALVTLLAPVAVGMALAFVIVILRQGALIALAIFAPLAIVLWVIPGTTKVFDRWRGILIGLILFYPTTQAIIAACAMMAIVIGNLGN